MAGNDKAQSAKSSKRKDVQVAKKTTAKPQRGDGGAPLPQDGRKCLEYCKLFHKGKCTRPDCVFLHMHPICYYHFNGTGCTQGSKCPHSHREADRRGCINMAFNGQCEFSAQTCSYSHDPAKVAAAKKWVKDKKAAFATYLATLPGR